MILQTGGRASGEISTRSSPSSWARLMASLVSMMPICSSSGPITRIGEMRMRKLTRVRCAVPESRLNLPNAMGLLLLKNTRANLETRTFYLTSTNHEPPRPRARNADTNSERPGRTVHIEEGLVRTAGARALVFIRASRRNAAHRMSRRYLIAWDSAIRTADSLPFGHSIGPRQENHLKGKGPSFPRHDKTNPKHRRKQEVFATGCSRVIRCEQIGP